ncbi:hypothetical protein E2C01_041177 [Portunus trituberculatus]|uniref:Uncharacterized protein n=1 Tax=Portunus trituberculatus TaxID=210409 RepID=A0A5B7FLQ3_PORTR|nr:hypothetical protein [Portunus trituberculatus]
MKNYQRNLEECCFSQDCCRTRDAHWHLVYWITDITGNVVSEWDTGGGRGGRGQGAFVYN